LLVLKQLAGMMQNRGGVGHRKEKNSEKLHTGGQKKEGETCKGVYKWRLPWAKKASG